MSSRQACLLFACFVALAACQGKPELDVETASAAAGSAPAALVSPTPAVSAELPPGHPPLDGAAAAPAASLPPGHPPLAPEAATDTDLKAVEGTVLPGGEGEHGLAWTAPAGWVAETPANRMRRAQYRIPGLRGDAECVVFYFGPGQGGEARENAERWAAQFTNADGSPATAALETRESESGGMKVLLVETRGTYGGGAMTGSGAGPQPGYALLGAIVEGPDANWFFKLTGPEATVAAQRAAFASLLGSMKRGASRPR